MIQLVLNNARVTVTGILAFFANYGRHPNLFNALRKSLQVVVALEDIKQLKQIHNKIVKDIEYNQKQSKNHINKKRKKKSQLKKRNKIYFLIKYLRIT